MTQEALAADWHGLAGRAGVPGAHAGPLFADLCRLYSEPARAYHTLAHVGAMLQTLSRSAGAARDGTALALAVWFHDAIYDSRRSDNEARSAAYALAALGDAGASPELLPGVERLILATKTHDAAAGDTDCQLLLDADLAVLGAGEEDYGRYARAIRAEYAWVPEADYRAGRRRVLEGFLGRDRIYYTDGLFRELERPARANLRREITWLTDPNSP